MTSLNPQPGSRNPQLVTVVAPPFTKKNDEELLWLWERGNTVDRLAEITGRPARQVQARITWLIGGGPKPKEPKPTRAKRGQPWSTPDEKTLMSMVADGYTWVQIGDRLERSPGACHMHHLKMTDYKEYKRRRL